MTNLGPAIERVQEAVRDGELKPQQGLAAIGTLAADHFDVEIGSRATRYRQRRRVQDLGLVLVDGVLEEVEVDLQDVMEQALDADAWQG